MKVCLVSREFAPYFGAGIGTYAANWARALTEAGHDVHVLTRHHEGVLEQGPRDYPGVTFHVIDPAHGPPRLDHNYPYARHSLAALATLRRLHERFGFDVIEYPDYWAEGHAISQAKRTKGEFAEATLICRLHTSSALCRELDGDATYPHYAAYLDIMEHESIAHADVVLSPSTDLLRTTGEFISQNDLGTIKDGRVLRYPFDTESISDLKPRGFRDESSSVPSVLYFGRLERRKGVDLLVKAALQLIERGVRARFTLVGGDTGSGPFGRSMRKHLESLIPAEHADAFDIRLPVPRAQLGELIEQAALCVFPARWDNFPNALLEAMAMGAPVVTTDAGGPGEIVQHETSGLVCPAEDPAALANEIDRLLRNQTLRQHIAGNAKSRIEALCAPNAIVREFEEIVSEAKNAPRAAMPGERQPLVSVIVPHYNLAEYLPETLHAIERQTYPNIETIIVDDGSTRADAKELIARLAREGKRVVRQANTGLSGARNTGVREARGTYVFPLDADDIISPTFIEKAVRAMEREPDLAYVTALVGYFRESPSRHFGGWVPLGLHRDLLPIHNCAGCCMALFRRDVLVDAGLYATELTSYEDWDLYCALAERGHKGAVIPDFMLHYRIRPDSLVRTEVELRKQHLHAKVLARHPGLARDHTRVQRTMLSEQMEAGNLERLGLRYRVADRLNEAIKGSPVHGLVKGLAERTIEAKRRSRKRADV